MKKITLLNVLTFFCLAISFGQAGTLDPTFGTNGIIRANLGITNSQQKWSSARQTLEGSDKSLYVLLDPEEGSNGSAFTKIFPNGSLDSTYGYNGYSVTLPMYDAIAAIQGDGKIVIAGSAIYIYGVNSYFNIMRLNTNGNLDSTFGKNGIEVNIVGRSAVPNSLLIQKDGKIVVAGSVETGSDQLFAVARYNADGSVDSSFNGNGQSFPNFGFTYITPERVWPEKDAANAILQQEDGKLLVAGQVTNWATGPEPYLFGLNYAIVRYNTNGSFDSSFGVNGWRFGTAGSGGPIHLGLQNDSKIVLGASLPNVDSSKFIVIRYSAKGFIDSTFGTNGTETFNPQLGNLAINSLAIQNDDKIVMGGNTLNYTTETDTIPGDFVIARFNNDGAPDPTFGNKGIIITDFGNSRNLLNSLFIQTDDKIIASGYYLAPNNVTTLQLARYNQDGSLDNTFNANGKIVGAFRQGNTQFNAIAIQADGKVLAAGYTFNGIHNAFLLVRYTPNGIPDSTFALNGEQITDISPGAPSTARSMALQPDGKIVIAGQAGNSVAVARYNTDGTLDASFNSSGYSIIGGIGDFPYQSIALQSDGKIVIGSSIFAREESSVVITRLNTDGKLDTSFNHSGTRITKDQPSGSYAIVIQKDGKILQAGNAIFRYNTDGSIDSSFGTNGKQTTYIGLYYYIAYSIALQNDGKIIAAGYGFTGPGPITSLTVARYQTNGQLDNSFNGYGYLQSPVMAGANSIAITEDGKIALGGTTYSDGSNTSLHLTGNFALTLLNADGSPDVTFGDNSVALTSSATGTGSDGGIQSMVINNNALFAAGFSTTPGNIGMLAKYILASGGALPVSFVDFTAALKNKTTLLQWQTSSEYNLSHFLIQHSAEVNSFSTIATIKAIGTKNTKTNYSTTDLYPLPGKNYYRLQLVDIDGSITYSKVVKVNNYELLTLKLFPNPAYDIIRVQANGNNEVATLQIIDVSGKIIYKTKAILTKDLSFPVNIQHLLKGVYNLKITTQSGTKTLQFIKQ